MLIQINERTIQHTQTDDLNKKKKKTKKRLNNTLSTQQEIKMRYVFERMYAINNHIVFPNTQLVHSLNVNTLKKRRFLSLTFHSNQIV